MQNEQANKHVAPSKNEFDSVFAEWTIKCSEFGAQKYKADVGNLLLKSLFNMWLEKFNSIEGIEDYGDSAVKVLTINSRDPKKQEKYAGWDIRIHKLFKSLMNESAIGNDLDKLKQKEFSKKILEIPMFSPYDPYMDAWARHYYPKKAPKTYLENEEHRELFLRQIVLKIHQFGSTEFGEYEDHAGNYASEEQLSKEQWYRDCRDNEKNHIEPAWFRICRDSYPELFSSGEL